MFSHLRKTLIWAIVPLVCTVNTSNTKAQDADRYITASRHFGGWAQAVYSDSEARGTALLTAIVWRDVSKPAESELLVVGNDRSGTDSVVLLGNARKAVSDFGISVAPTRPISRAVAGGNNLRKLSKLIDVLDASRTSIAGGHYRIALYTSQGLDDKGLIIAEWNVDTGEGLAVAPQNPAFSVLFKIDEARVEACLELISTVARSKQVLHAACGSRASIVVDADNAMYVRLRDEWAVLQPLVGSVTSLSAETPLPYADLLARQRAVVGIGIDTLTATQIADYVASPVVLPTESPVVRQDPLIWLIR